MDRNMGEVRRQIMGRQMWEREGDIMGRHVGTGKETAHGQTDVGEGRRHIMGRNMGEVRRQITGRNM